ncbi:MAG: c-type cytochrome [Planctomycetes bacterium]|nr:c-type cytochrome [Planctomycetota bacterium]
MAFLPMVGAQEHHWLDIGWLDVPVDSAAKPPEDDANRQAGEKIYLLKCYFCHGDRGDGEGRSEVYRMDPRPRNFMPGKFKFKTVSGDEPPLDEDLYRTVTRGVVGTAMPFWSIPGEPADWANYRYLLSPQERWQVIYFIKTFSAQFKSGLRVKIEKLKKELEKAKSGSKEAKDLKSALKVAEKKLADYDEARKNNPPISIGTGPEVTPGLIEAGRKLFAEEGAGCAKCHGVEGRGDGMERKNDDWGFPMVAANLTRAVNFKGGNGMREVYRTITTGLNGTPMPSTLGMFSKDAAEDEQKRWAIAAYVHHLSETSHPKVDRAKTVLKARRVEGTLPADPKDGLWAQADLMDVPMTGQVMVEPRQWWPRVNVITVRALYNGDQVAFHLAWDDRTRSLGKLAEGQKMPEGISQVYPDAVHVQFPARLPDGPEKPHFFLGEPGKPVNLWHYQADWEGESSRRSPVEEQTSSGSRRLPASHPAESQQVNGRGVFSNGQWQVVMVRSLVTEDVQKDIQFVRGRLIPVSFAVWEGDSGDHGNQASISSWYYLVLETETPPTVYLWTVLAVLFTGVLEFWLVKKARSARPPREQASS